MMRTRAYVSRLSRSRDKESATSSRLVEWPDHLLLFASKSTGRAPDSTVTIKLHYCVASAYIIRI